MGQGAAVQYPGARSLGPMLLAIRRLEAGVIVKSDPFEPEFYSAKAVKIVGFSEHRVTNGGI
jgi:hypothetical protein